MFREQINDKSFTDIMNHVKYLLLFGLLFIACGPKGPTVAERRAAQVEQWREQLATERQTLHVTDSLIAALVPKVNEATAKNGFEYEKTEYDDLGRFKPNGMDPGENVQRTYLRSAVDDYGRTQLIATYCGARSFIVHQLRVQSSDGTSVTTSSIAPNDGSNYSYDIDGTHYQSVTFAYTGRITEGMSQDSTVIAHADTDGGALGFIAQHNDDAKLCGFLIDANGKEQRITINEKERKALTATYELGIMLRESIRLQQENKTASLKIEYLEQKLQEKQNQQ